MRRGNAVYRIMAFALAVCVLCPGCAGAKTAPADSLRDAEFVRIEKECRTFAESYLDRFAKVYAQFFYDDANKYSGSDYEVSDVYLHRRIYTYVSEGDTCLALPFEA